LEETHFCVSVALRSDDFYIRFHFLNASRKPLPTLEKKSARFKKRILDSNANAVATPKPNAKVFSTTYYLQSFTLLLLRGAGSTNLALVKP
jgi:hypothetical protein